MTQRCHFDPSLLRAYVNVFQLPRAILALRGNWLIPNRKILRVIGCLKAGDYCASQPRLLSLTLPLAIRNKRDAKVFLYAIGLGWANASLRASGYQSAAPFGKGVFLNSIHGHPASPRQC